MSSSGRSWVSMGPLGWLFFLVFVLPFLAAWWLLVGLIWLCVWTCQAIAAHRAAASGRLP